MGTEWHPSRDGNMAGTQQQHRTDLSEKRCSGAEDNEASYRGRGANLHGVAVRFQGPNSARLVPTHRLRRLQSLHAADVAVQAHRLQRKAKGSFQVWETNFLI